MKVNNYLNTQGLAGCPGMHVYGGNPSNLLIELKIKQSNDGSLLRNFWCIKISCDCGIKTDWFVVSEHDAIEPDQEKINEVIKIWNNRR